MAKTHVVAQARGLGRRRSVEELVEKLVVRKDAIEVEWLSRPKPQMRDNPRSLRSFDCDIPRGIADLFVLSLIICK